MSCSICPLLLSGDTYTRESIIFFVPFIGLNHKEDIDFISHNFTADPYFNFTLQQQERRCFEIEIINDNVTEDVYEYFYYTLGVYNDEPTTCRTARIRIEDNESKLFITLLL